MLRDLKRVPLPPSWRARWITVGALLVLAVAASGFRAMQTGAKTFAQQPKPQNTARLSRTTQEALRFEYVPRDAAVVLALRPARLLMNPMVAQQVAAFEEIQKYTSERLGMTLTEVEQVLGVVMLRENPQQGPDRPCFIVRLRKPVNEAMVVKILGENPKKSQYDGRAVYNNNSQYCAIADEHTLIAAHDEGLLRRLIVAGADATPPRSVAATWNELANADAGAFINTGHMRAALDKELQQGPQGNPIVAMAPIWQKSNALAVGVYAGDKVEVQLVVSCEKPEDVKTVQDTISTAMTIARSGLAQFRAAASREPGEQGVVALKTIDLGEDILDQVKISSEGNLVRATAALEGPKVVQLTATLASAVRAAQGAAGRTNSMNNMKQLGLAMHNYHDTHNHFPAASVIGPDGKTPHSWRVELLPYLEQEALYRRYKMDEPWDSPNNKTVLEQMPPVFRDPNAPQDSKNSSYFVVVGQGTIFGDKEGASMATILDGTSNTIMIVEAQRDVPWTKPEDIEFNPEQAPPELGGHYQEGFLATLADGSVRFISKAVDPQLLKLLLLKGDGQPIAPIP